MTTGTSKYRSDFARGYYDDGEAHGRAEGKAESLLKILIARGSAIPEETRVRITDCTDVDQLDRWIDQALAGTAVDDLFER